MGRAVLVGRLAVRDLRRRPAEAALLLLAIAATSITLTLGLLLHGVTSHPYQRTRVATAGPDVVATVTPLPVGGRPADVAALRALAHARGVSGHSGPYPIVEAAAGAHGHVAAVQVEGRDPGAAPVDQPRPTQGGWVREGGVVVERSFADAFRLSAGDPVTVGGRSFRVVGVAVTAAMSPYPSSFCLTPCGTGGAAADSREPHPGLIWMTRRDAQGLSPRAKVVSYILNLKLTHPAAAPLFADAHNVAGLSAPTLEAWQDIRQQDSNLIRNEQRVLLTGSWLLSMLALASIAVLVGGRMADQMRRVGLLKAVGATPRLIAAVLLAEYVGMALVAAAVGLLVGWLAAPLLTNPTTGLIGGAGGVHLTTSTVGLVAAVALGVAALATFVPAMRAARVSTVRALADSARPPRRSGRLIAMSAWLPVPLLIGLRVAGRRPRRVILSVASVAITVSGIIAVLAAHAQLGAHKFAGSPGLVDPRAGRLNHVLLAITVMLLALAAVNAIFVTWATVLDARHSSALSRALGATPWQVSAGLSSAQVLPALAGALLGVPGGIAVLAAVSPSQPDLPPLWWMLVAVVATPLLTAALTAVPAGFGGRRPVAEILRSELA